MAMEKDWVEQKYLYLSDLEVLILVYVFNVLYVPTVCTFMCHFKLNQVLMYCSMYIFT